MPFSPEPHSDRIPCAANVASCCSKTFFEKLAKYIGHGIKRLIDRPDGRYCFRLHNNRVYYVSEALLKHASALPRDKLHQLGCTFGKFTKTGKFRLHVTCLDYLAQFAKYKVWVKPSSELSYLYGNNVLKAGLGRITENTPQYQVRHPASSRAARPL
jgi:60S ribosome subunit biogenesis protein NIP7